MTHSNDGGPDSRPGARPATHDDAAATARRPINVTTEATGGRCLSRLLPGPWQRLAASVDLSPLTRLLADRLPALASPLGVFDLDGLADAVGFSPADLGDALAELAALALADVYLDRAELTSPPWGPWRPVRPTHAASAPAYGGVHQRLRTSRGIAAAYVCASCQQAPAADWSYVGGDPDERTQPVQGGAPLRYSLDPSRYIPRCRSCHRKADAGHRWGGQPPYRRAAEWLREYLRQHGPVVDASDAYAAAELVGHTRDVLGNARKYLGVESTPVPGRGTSGRYWSLPVEVDSAGTETAS